MLKVQIYKQSILAKQNYPFPDLSYSNYQNFTITYLFTKEHMSMPLVKCIVIQIKGQSRDLPIAKGFVFLYEY
jgi:hypothetical protein